MAVPDVHRNAILIAVTAIMVAGLLLLGASAGQANWPVYLAVVIVGLGIAVRVDRRHPLSWLTRVGLAIFAIGHVAGGMVPVGDGVLYGAWLIERLIRYDNTARDLVANLVGGLGMATWTARHPPMRLPLPEHGADSHG